MELGTLSTCGNCYVVVKRYWAFRGFLSFWKRSVSLRFLGVFLCWVFFDLCLWFRLWDDLTFCFSPVLLQRENSISTTRRFDDRPSLRACTAWAKKILISSMTPKTSTFFDLKTCLRSKAPHSTYDLWSFSPVFVCRTTLISWRWKRRCTEQEPCSNQTKKINKLEMRVWAWEPMIYKMSCPWLTLHRMEYCFKWVWEAASASLVLIHSYPRPHVLVANLHGSIGVCCGLQAFWPSCRRRQNIYYYNGHATDICPW